MGPLLRHLRPERLQVDPAVRKAGPQLSPNSAAPKDAVVRARRRNNTTLLSAPHEVLELPTAGGGHRAQAYARLLGAADTGHAEECDPELRELDAHTAAASGHKWLWQAWRWVDRNIVQRCLGDDA